MSLNFGGVKSGGATFFILEKIFSFFKGG